jgi:hypothetical protein
MFNLKAFIEGKEKFFRAVDMRKENWKLEFRGDETKN